MKFPGFGDNHKATIQDLAISTGKRVILGELGMKLKETTLELLGSSKKLLVNKNDIMMIGGIKTRSRSSES